MYRDFGLYIDGTWKTLNETAEVLSPVTEKVLGASPAATVSETEAAIEAAAKGLAAWSATGSFARADASPMGLSAFAFTQSPARARRVVAELKSGMVGINSFALAATEAPFGGTNFSGMGREDGLEGIEDCLDTKLAQVVF